MFTNHIYLIYKPDLALNNLHWLICHKTKPNQLAVTPTEAPDAGMVHFLKNFNTEEFQFFNPVSSFK